MWWLFSKRSEDGNYIEYAYSRGNRSLDGLIRVGKDGNNAQLLKACDADASPPYNGEDALEFVYILHKEGFPVQRQISCC